MITLETMQEHYGLGVEVEWPTYITDNLTGASHVAPIKSIEMIQEEGRRRFQAVTLDERRVGAVWLGVEVSTEDE